MRQRRTVVDSSEKEEDVYESVPMQSSVDVHIGSSSRYQLLEEEVGRDVSAELGESENQQEQEEPIEEGKRSFKSKFNYHKARFIKFKNNIYTKRFFSVVLFWMKLLSGPVLALPFFCGALTEWGSTVDVDRCAGITAWIACYWILQPVPLPVTSLLPLLLFPLLGTTSGKSMAHAYYNDTSFLFIGSFIIASAIEKWNIHKRFALFAMSIIGLRPRILLFGFTCVVGFITMWISNSATTAMFMPMANAVIASIRARNEENPIKEEREKEEVKIKKFSKALFMIIPYTSSIMGCATLIGTPSNLVIGQVLNSKYKKLATSNDNPVSFLNWFVYAFPPMIVLLLMTFVYFLIVLVRTINVDKKEVSLPEIVEIGETNLNESLLNEKDRELEDVSMTEYYVTKQDANQQIPDTIIHETPIETQLSIEETSLVVEHPEKVTLKKSKKKQPNIFKIEYKKLGKIKFEEIVITIVFIIMCCLWIFRDLSFGSLKITWSYLIFYISGKLVKKQETIMSYPTDGTVAVIAGIILYFIPSFNLASEPLVNKEKDPYDSRTRLQRFKAFIFKWRTPTGRIIEWKETQSKMPWDILLLLGAGFALAQAFADSGFSEFIVNVLVVKLDLANKTNPFTLLFIIVLGICCLTQLTGNTSIALLSMPVLAALGPKLGQSPAFFMAPATLACSMAFMTPIGTSTNLLAFASNQFSILDGLIHGGVINVISVPVIVLGSMALFPAIEIKENVIPDWAIANSTISA